jgi:UDP-N-acetylmuramate dehydrogenase
MSTLSKILEKINTDLGYKADIRYEEPMSGHTTFKVGGPADAWIRPRGDSFPSYAAAILETARSEGIPVFLLGGGANLVVADSGLRGIVLDSTGWTGWDFSLPEREGAGILMRVRSGTPADEAAEAAAREGWGGLDFLAGMPGTIGGAVWMNARCYGASVSDILEDAEFLAAGGGPETLKSVQVSRFEGDFSYKKSPFQSRKGIILSARFRLRHRDREELGWNMAERRRERENKGHYRAPSAGSAFKNNRDFGKPTGQILDELGLRGLTVGGAAIAPWHGNIVINTGNARAADIRALTEAAAEKAKAALGIDLEPEILFAGDWNGFDITDNIEMNAE